MCGIIGVLNVPAAAEEIFLGLQNLQHRGQDGGGIVTLDNGVFHQHRGTGLLDIAFPPENFRKLTGHIGIGHTRYATVGKSDMTMLQPFFSEESGLAIAHNGNIVNFHPLREAALKANSKALKTECDSELILYALAKGVTQYGQTIEGLAKSVQHLSETLIGGYAVIGIAHDLGLFAFRDPNGLRPLIIGTREEASGEKSIAFASESSALEFLGFSELDDVHAGELVIVTLDGQIHRQFYTAPQPRHCMFEWVYFARVESRLEALSVYQARFNLGIHLAQAVKEQDIHPDIVVPVPETSRIAAIALAEKMNVPFREVLIKNRYVNRTFILESQKARQEAIRRKLYPVASELKDKKVLIVDDSIVRGNTAIQIIDMVRKAGAKEIYFASTCPPIQFPCFYGIDFPDRNELMAGRYNKEELAGIFGVDRLVYLSLEGLKEALNGENTCTACLTGDYPTDVSSGEAFTKQRELSRKVAPL